MKVQLNILPFIGSILAFVIAYMTITEKIDQYIQFAGEMNAFGFFFFAFLLGIAALVASVEPIKSK